MRLRADTVIGAILVALVTTLFLMSFALPPAPYGTMGPALFPRVLLIALFPLCAALFMKGFLLDLRTRPEPMRAFSEWFHDYRNVLASYALFFIFVLAIPWAGYMVSGFVFLLFMQVALGPKGWAKVPQFVAVTIGVLAGLYFIFRVVLLVLLPEGEIGLF
ncbi:MAG: tripartite tricarboxylate transporter TctB family protein [bacterium]